MTKQQILELLKDEEIQEAIGSITDKARLSASLDFLRSSTEPLLLTVKDNPLPESISSGQIEDEKGQIKKHIKHVLFQDDSLFFQFGGIFLNRKEIRAIVYSGFKDGSHLLEITFTDSTVKSATIAAGQIEKLSFD